MAGPGDKKTKDGRMNRLLLRGEDEKNRQIFFNA